MAVFVGCRPFLRPDARLQWDVLATFGDSTLTVPNLEGLTVYLLMIAVLLVKPQGLSERG